METEDFEGTLILEKLAELNLVDDFFEAVDADDFSKASAIMKRAGIDEESISIALAKMRDSDD